MATVTPQLVTAHVVVDVVVDVVVWPTVAPFRIYRLVKGQCRSRNGAIRRRSQRTVLRSIQAEMSR
jgi:hypothetical protein